MQTNADAQRDLDTLTSLNLDFFASVQKGDVKRFEEILADDFRHFSLIPTESDPSRNPIHRRCLRRRPVPDRRLGFFLPVVAIRPLLPPVPIQ